MIIRAASSDRAVCVRFNSDQPVTATPYQLKGAIIRTFPNHVLIPYINGEYRTEFRYPRVQLKVLRQQLCIFGIGDGYSAVTAFKDELKKVSIEETTYEFDGMESLDSDIAFEEQSDTFSRYKFITPWVALNNRALAQYRTLLPRDRMMYLNRLLVQNLLFIARDLGYDMKYTISARVKLQSLTPRVVEDQGSGSFKGYFTCNMNLPDYLGLGNGITKGLGTIVKM